MSSPFETAIVFPCYQEATRLNTDAFAEFIGSHPQVHCIFVNDGSTDGTAALLETIRARFPETVTVITNDHNKGKAESVRLGCLEALEHPPVFLGFFDADLATPLSAIDPLLKKFEQRPDAQMVIGSRVRMGGRAIDRNALRHYFSRIFMTIVSWLLDITLYDTQCGAKFFRVNPETEELFREPFISRWIFDIEIFLRLRSQSPGKKLEDIVYEYPLDQWNDVRGSKMRFSDFLKAPVDLVRLMMHYRS